VGLHELPEFLAEGLVEGTAAGCGVLPGGVVFGGVTAQSLLQDGRLQWKNFFAAAACIYFTKRSVSK
jgi:hypothetical protein